LNSENKINGLGRRIYLREYSQEYYYDSLSYDFIDEGQFKDDKLEGFGRRFYLNKTKDTRIGWFK